MNLYKIPNIDNYLINKNGFVFSVVKNKFLKPLTNGRGYRFYVLYHNGKRRCYFRHRLLMITFRPIESTEGMSIDHINGIPGDDRLENLEWVTHSENVKRYKIQ